LREELFLNTIRVALTVELSLLRTLVSNTDNPMPREAKDPWLPPTTPCSPSAAVAESHRLSCHDDKRFQQMEKRLNEQAEATRAMNKTLNKFITIMSNIEAAKVVTPPPLVSSLLVTTPLQVSQPSRVKPGIPSNIDGDRAQGRAFLTSCELYILLTALDFVDEQVRIHPISRADMR
jgi:hypothetical protein